MTIQTLRRPMRELKMIQKDKEKMAKIICRRFALSQITFEVFKRFMISYDILSTQEHIREDYNSLFR